MSGKETLMRSEGDENAFSFRARDAGNACMHPAPCGYEIDDVIQPLERTLFVTENEGFWHTWKSFFFFIDEVA